LSVSRSAPSAATSARPEPAAVALTSVAIEAGEIRQQPEERFKEAKAAVDLTQAPLIVSVGRGIKEQKNIDLVRQLSEALGAELAASRPICDNDWLPMDRQIGSSGQTVAPKLYLAVGISGAIQHLVGMKGARTIVAINRDKDAPIFEIADYGVVGDLFEIVPALTAASGEESRLVTGAPIASRQEASDESNDQSPFTRMLGHADRCWPLMTLLCQLAGSVGRPRLKAGAPSLTALDRYVATPDSNYAYRLVETIRRRGFHDLRHPAHLAAVADAGGGRSSHLGALADDCPARRCQQPDRLPLHLRRLDQQQGAGSPGADLHRYGGPNAVGRRRAADDPQRAAPLRRREVQAE
jgi:hypothetical protein